MSKRRTDSISYAVSLLAAMLLLVAGVASLPIGTKPGFLGLEFAPLTAAAQARAPFLTHGGALVARVVHGSPAAAAGFAPGDIVVAIDRRVVSSADDAVDVLGSSSPGSKIAVEVYDNTNLATHARILRAELASGPPLRRNVYTVVPPPMLARSWEIAPAMAARASWSRKIARGAVEPLALKIFSNGRCSAVAPEDWRVADAGQDDKSFALVSPSLGARAIFASMPMANEASEAAVGRVAEKFARVAPELSASENAPFGFRVVDFGSSAGYAGFALFRVVRQGRARSDVSVRLVAVPANNVGQLAPLAGAVALSIRCAAARKKDQWPFDADLAATSVSVRCLRGACDESDFAGAYNEIIHTGYVHSARGENFLIDPRRDVWATGPSGTGTYRQVKGMLEKLEPGRTN